ncbi:hypothetical protein HPB50_007553 [Hyalomma asiaticum]|uniref:Uncharacterized protein n=1 Tax=Hyalomma asiaticum TaxID=266040 RepID=A0ACB7TE22_HYAAI|nr:hypothetical protein HPB50_007553 [Hyalomma asiaticum]
MALRTANRSGSWLTLVLLVLSLASPAVPEPMHNQTGRNSSATIETYSTDDTVSSCAFMSGIGTGILRGIADSPDDAYVLEEAADNPNAGAVKELVTYHQRGVNVFLTVLWGVVIFFSIFMIAAIIQVLYIMCTGTFKHYVAKSNRGAYIFCVIVVAILLVVMIILLVFLIGCRGALVYSAEDKIPAVYVLTFDNLRKFVRLTATESSTVTDQRPKVQRVLGDGFSQAFGDFVAKIADIDGQVPLVNLDSECTPNNVHSSDAQLADADFWLSEKSGVLAKRCAHIRHMKKQLLDKMARTVAVSTEQYRRELTEILSDLTFVADASYDGAVQASIESIDQLQTSVGEYENSKGTFGTLSGEAYGGGRCSTLRSILSSFMNVVCACVLELVGYWTSLLLATFGAITVIPFCFMLSKYFFRTKRKKLRDPIEKSSSAADSLPEEDTSGGLSVSLTLTTQQETPSEVTRRVVYQSQSTRTYRPHMIISPTIVRQTSLTSFLSRIPMQHINRIHSETSFGPAPMLFPGSTVCHHHHSHQHQHHYHPPLPVMTAPVHTSSCILSAPAAPAMLNAPRSSLTVHRVHSNTAVDLDKCHHTTSAVVTTTQHVGSSPSVVRTLSKTAVVASPTAVLVQPANVATPPPAVVVPPPTVLAQPAAVLTTPRTVAMQTPPVPLVVQAPPSAPPATVSPIGTGPAENQQAATAHMTINFYGSPAGGTFGIPVAGYPTGYLTTAGQPYYYAASPAAYAATAPAATPAVAQPVAYATTTPATSTPVTPQTVTYAVPAGQEAAPYQYVFTLPDQSISTASVSTTRSVRTLPSSFLSPAATVPVETTAAASAPVAVQPVLRVSSATKVRSLHPTLG